MANRRSLSKKAYGTKLAQEVASHLDAPTPLLLAMFIGCASPTPSRTTAPSVAASASAPALTEAPTPVPATSASASNSTAETPAPRVVVCNDCNVPPIVTTIQFDHKNSKLSPQNLEVLDAVYQTLVAHPTLVVVIRGHIDESEKEYFQQSFGHHRAKAVWKFLVSHGIEPQRLLVKDYGADTPLAMPKTPEDRAKNRRVDFEVIKAPENR
jgi:outer membrane protein OmpA-like peptidoglycan-associated protein